MEKLITTLTSWKTKSFAINMYKRWYKPGYCTKRTWIVIIMFHKKGIFMTNGAFIGVFVMRLDSAAIVIVEFQSRSVGDMGDQFDWRFDYDLCDQVAICLCYERITTDLCARESTDSNLGDHGDQLEANQRSISVLEDLCDLHGALWHSHRSPQIGA